MWKKEKKCPQTLRVNKENKGASVIFDGLLYKQRRRRDQGNPGKPYSMFHVLVNKTTNG